jgi:hypothetical protein
MWMLEEWVIIALALGSALSVWRYFGGAARVGARLWIVLFYIIVWTDKFDIPILASLSRYGLAFLFLADILPAINGIWSRYAKSKYDNNA